MRAALLLLAACGVDPDCPRVVPYRLTLGACVGSLLLGGIRAGAIDGGRFSLECPSGSRHGTVTGYCGAGDATLHLDDEPRAYGAVTLAVVHIYADGVLSGLAYTGPVDFTFFDTSAHVENFQAVP